MTKEPEVSVGIVSAQNIKFRLNANYTAKGETVCGEQEVSFFEGAILWKGSQYKELTFRPQEENPSFSLYDVTIGVNFHWERKETQVFSNTLKFVVEEDKICAINILPVEDYLISVISSEMKATSSLEFLKAHAVISRSWLLAQIAKRKALKKEDTGFFSIVHTKEEYIRWYDREDHTIFDVCADDHCQRYQGITKATSSIVAQAIEETRGEVLTSGKSICDARFSKCCGGISEEFEACWEDKHYSYLVPVRCECGNSAPLPDLTQEAEAERWIRNSPAAFCNTTDRAILSQILNNYDQETTDFYRWRVSYTQEQLSELIARKTKIDFGKIKALVPIERGKSGRIIKLRIEGTERSLTIGKELEIRRALSESHLFSSAFIVESGEEKEGVPESFTIIGAGWGHGVGLCQIGAAVMGEKGKKYDDILLHYYVGAEITQIY